MGIWMECIRGGYILTDLNRPSVWWRSGRVTQVPELEVSWDVSVGWIHLGIKRRELRLEATRF